LENDHQADAVKNDLPDLEAPKQTVSRIANILESLQRLTKYTN